MLITRFLKEIRKMYFNTQKLKKTQTFSITTTKKSI